VAVPPARAESVAYSVREAAARLGCSVDALERHYGELRGYRVGRRILFPRWAIDRLVIDPDAPEAIDPNGPGGTGGGTPVERVLALLPLLSGAERVRIAQAALTAPDAGGRR
jgi:excisionase family DNA binding protein